MEINQGLLNQQKAQERQITLRFETEIEQLKREKINAIEQVREETRMTVMEQYTN
jgi:ribosomal protein L7/L12